MRKLSYTLVSSLALAVIAALAGWWFELSNVPDNFTGWAHTLDFGLFLVLTYVIWQPLVMEVLAWAVAGHIQENKYRTPRKNLRVAFVTTFVPASESIELLKKTLPAMKAAYYRHDTWLLDEGNDYQARQLCLDLGVKHFSRAGQPHYNTTGGKFAAKTKGGNHNAWLDQHGKEYDIVAHIDTDFVPARNFLMRTLGYFKDKRVAFVGTPQIYGNTEESFIAHGAAEQTYAFYGPILRGFNGMGSTLLIGANHVIRVKALRDVDDYSAHITEDLLTGMKLHARGWKSVYVPEALAVGEGPTNWASYFNQQMRWASGCIDILLRHTPKLLRQMKPRQAIYYFFMQQHYFSGLAMMLSLVSLGLYFMLGLKSTNVDFGIFLELYAVAVLTCLFMSLWLQRYNVRPKHERGLLMSSRVLSVATWPVYLMALFSVLTGTRLTFKVTPKGEGFNRADRTVEFRVFAAHLMIGLICVMFIIFGFALGHEARLMLVWAAVGAFTMLSLPFSVLAYTFFQAVQRFGTYDHLESLHQQRR